MDLPILSEETFNYLDVENEEPALNMEAYNRNMSLFEKTLEDNETVTDTSDDSSDEDSDSDSYSSDGTENREDTGCCSDELGSDGEPKPKRKKKS